MKQLTPQEIEAESFRLIEHEAGAHGFAADAWQVVRRVIHATADFSIIDTVRFGAGALAAGIDAIRRGRPVYTDTQMLASAINKAALERWGCDLICCISDQELRERSRASGETRSALAMRKAAPQLQGAIVAIGNAPTALHEAITLCEQGALQPALIVGLPVGFVEARESKERLHASGITCITNIDRKGGTPAAAAVMNAILKLAES